MKHYLDIERLKPSIADGFSVGDEIYIEEKIDGANFSFKYDVASDSIKAFSRKKELDMKNNLRGAWDWAQTLDKELLKHVLLGDRLIVFCEWLVKHTVPYPAERYQHAYCFDIYDTVGKNYLGQYEAMVLAKAIGVEFVPVFYHGDFKSWDDVRSFVGRTDLGGDYGEGIVVKNMRLLKSEGCDDYFYTKIVGDKFSERKGSKEQKVPKEQNQEFKRNHELAETIITRARVEKLIHKMVDDGILPEDWGAKEMKIIAQNLFKNLYYDCVKEEKEVVDQIGETFGKLCGSIGMGIAREILAEREQI